MEKMTKEQAIQPKIDWSKAPKWANYYAINGYDGRAYWFEAQPYPDKKYREWDSNGKMFEFHQKYPIQYDWEQTLIQRPDNGLHSLSLQNSRF